VHRVAVTSIDSGYATLRTSGPWTRDGWRVRSFGTYQRLRESALAQTKPSSSKWLQRAGYAHGPISPPKRMSIHAVTRRSRLNVRVVDVVELGLICQAVGP